MSDCVFCSIIERQIPANIIAESENILVIQDKAPKAPIHYLIIPKKHLESLHSLTQDDARIAADILLMAKELSTKLEGEKAFRLVFNNGYNAGQRVFHSHAHFLSGKHLSEF
ncbi:hypothetical protein A3F66_03175 [candidate division TM6 bacterium RIFCSPHIGHO2_12_FULL_32_22]|nr:MAG: hypothetical protein A3F66_03175 [candidate division TM6 bacterium RIFCSPHIGHO2_12_FULL_32_22]